MKKVKINKKRLFLSIMILIIIILVIVFGIKLIGNKDETSGDMNLDGSQETVDTPSQEDVPVQENAVPGVVDDLSGDTQESEVTVPQQATDNVEEFVDEQGNKMDENVLQTNKDTIIQAFKAIPADKLGLTADLASAKIMFSQGITTIATNECFVFNVYVNENGSLKNAGVYAMSRDTTVLYKFNSASLEYELIEI